MADIKLYNGKPVRADYDKVHKELLVSCVDVAAVLAAPTRPRNYWSDLKRRLANENVQLHEKIVQLKLPSSDGKSYNTDVLDKRGVRELAAYIRSNKTADFLLWLEKWEPNEVKFMLKHKDVDVVEVELAAIGDIINMGKIYSVEHLPVGTYLRGQLHKNAIRDWWRGRTIPASRERLKELLDKLDMRFPQELLEKSFGLSLSDQYWISPVTDKLEWENVNFFQHDFSEDVGNILFGKRSLDDIKDGMAISLMSPDNTSDGMLKKKWKIIDGKRCLIKGGSGANKQEVANEVLASMICERLDIPHIKYYTTMIDGEPFSVCEDFVDADTELVTAWHIKQLIKKDNNTNEYNNFINKCKELGIPDIRLRMDQMLTLDFILANTDRHYNNFGLIRNANTLEWLRFAPIYDSGTSMWCDKDISQIHPRNISIESKPFRSTHSKQIELVSDFSWLRLDRLNGIEDEYLEVLNEVVYFESQKERNRQLCFALRQRVELLRELVR